MHCFWSSPDFSFMEFLIYILEISFTSSPPRLSYATPRSKLSFFSVRHQVPVLPEGEPLWALAGLTELNYAGYTSHLKAKQLYTKLATNQFSNLCWPPVNVKASVPLPSASNTYPNKIIEPASIESLQYVFRQFPAAIESSENVSRQLPKSIHMEDVPVPCMIDEVDITALESARSDKDILCLETLEEDQSYITGRQGEMIAYRYFTEKLAEAAVQWVNGDSEMGLPYDLIIKQESKSLYVEVKSTLSASKTGSLYRRMNDSVL